VHFDFIAEGWKPDLDQFENWMNTRTFSMPLKHKDGSVTIGQAPGALRPRRAYTYVFPREHLQQVINSLNPERCVTRHDGAGTPIGSFAAAFLRKGLRLEKFPDAEVNGIQFPLVKKNLRIIGLGCRDDIDILQKGIEHEGL